MSKRTKISMTLATLAVHLVVGLVVFFSWHLIYTDVLWYIIKESYINAGDDVVARITEEANNELATAGFWVWMLTLIGGVSWVSYSCIMRVYDPREVGDHGIAWWAIFVILLVSGLLLSYYWLELASAGYLKDTAVIGFATFAMIWVVFGYWVISGLLFTWRPLRPAVPLGPLLPW